jgi:fumarate reductase (CoM/CoB) subunit B
MSKVSVFRFDPTRDSRPRYEIYRVPFKKGMRILDALNYIREEMGIDIAIDWDCGFRRCGSCGVMVNGEPKLACWDPAEVEMTIEPLAGFPVIRDLTVDKSLFEKRLRGFRPWIHRVERHKGLYESIKGRDTPALNIKRCIGCYLCLAACPITEVAWKSFAGPAAFVELGKAMLDPRDKLDRATIALSENIYDCMMCKKCRQVCPMKLAIPELVIRRIRHMVAKGGLGPLPEHKELSKNAVETGKTITRLSGESLMNMIPEIITPKEPKYTVGYFVGCEIDLCLQNVGKATINVLTKNGIRVVVPHNQVCCGYPMLVTGKLDLVKQNLVEKNIKVFERYGLDTVIASCPGCAITWRTLYPEYAENLLGRKAKFQVLHVIEYLNRIGLDTKAMKPVNLKVTYHDPCNLNRGLGVYEEPRNIIKKIPGVSIIDMEKSEMCCGAGGAVKAARRDLSYLIGNRKGDYIKKARPDLVVSACPTCERQLREIGQKRGLSKVLDITELLAMAYS